MTLDSQSFEMLTLYLEPIQKYLDNSNINDVVINRPHEVFIKGGSGQWEKQAREDKLTFNHCLHLATLIASYNSKKIPKKGFLSASLPGGERINISVPPACERNTVSFTIRKQADVEKSIDQLDEEGAFTQAVSVHRGIQDFERELLALKNELKVRQFLEMAVLKKRTILIVGVTGSGKTFIMKSLTKVIPAYERLITIEDVHEVSLKSHENKVHLFFAREEEGGEKPSPKEALAACLRMEPSRILLAELRGDEAWEFIKNVGTGHGGSITTAHAGGAWEAFEQLASLVKDSKTGAHLDIEYIKRRLYSVIDIVLFYDQKKLREIYYDPEFKQQNLA
ncbi:P-type DNA transfer ATPase VirB11 [Undibacterium sp.]|uniref:P-type DNA transfer ATPase VirB11 n=1 Tax=Undibacterium sp. TaxID=1914977 RepID=UPI00374FDD1D